MATPLTKVKLHISPSTNIEGILPKQQGIVADIFDAAENPAFKPFHLAEKFHPSVVWFKLSISSPKLREHFREMAKLKHLGFENFGVLLSRMRDFDDLYKVRMVAGEEGINLGIHTQFGVAVEYPSLAMLGEKLCKNGPSLIMIDIDALSNRMLGGDASGGMIHSSVLKLVEDMEGIFSRYGIPVGAYGKVVKNHDNVEQLTQRGINFFVTAPENAESLKKILLHAEKKREIEHLRDRIKMHLARRKNIY